MNLSLTLALLTLAAYLLGSVSFAILVSRALGKADPRSYGSKNPGATNVLRGGGKAAAVLTLVLDAAKGWVAVAAVAWCAPQLAAWGVGAEHLPLAMALAGLAAFLGHLYPVFFKFAGGKGVATAAGVLLGVSPWLGLMALAAWLGVMFTARYSALAAGAAALAAPLAYTLFGGSPTLWFVEKPLMAAIVVMSVLLIYRHRSNFERLLKGTEPKFGSK